MLIIRLKTPTFMLGLSSLQADEKKSFWLPTWGKALQDELTFSGFKEKCWSVGYTENTKPKF
jgi:hypothetical protein